MGLGGGARPQQTQSAARPHQGLTSVSLFFIIFFFVYTGLRSPEALSGGEPAEFTMQQPGREKGILHPYILVRPNTPGAYVPRIMV